MRKILDKFNWFIESYAKEYIISIILLILNYFLILLPPWLLGSLIDDIRSNAIDMRSLFIKVSIMIAVIISMYVVNYYQQFILFKAGDKISKLIREKIVLKILKQGPMFFLKNPTGSIMGKATNDVSGISELAGFGVLALFDSTVYPLVVIFMMTFKISWLLTFFAILPLPLMFLISKFIGAKLYSQYNKVQEAFDDMNSKVLENVSAVRVIRAYVKENIEKMRFKEKSEKLYKENMAIAALEALFPFTSRIVPGFSYLITFILGAYLIANSNLSIGNLISFIIYLNMLEWPMYALGDYINVSQQGLASMDRIDELLEYKEDIENSGKEILDDFQVLEFRNFSFSYPNAKEDSLKEINISLEKGKTLGLVGKIGSGKTSLLKQLLRFYPVKEKSIYINSIPIEAYEIKSIRDKIAYVPQNHILFSKSIKENVEFGEKPDGNLSLEEAIYLADFAKDVGEMKDGLNQIVGEKGISLSGGQKQRTQIARALIGQREILIMDDSLSAVDAKTEESIIKNIEKIRTGKTNIISSHRLSSVMKADEIIVLDHGKIIERGNHQELISLGGWYAKQFEIQQLEVGNEEE